MDFQQYLLALQARRKVFLLVFAAILVTAVNTSRNTLRRACNARRYC